MYVLSMKWAMLVVSEVATVTFEFGLTAMPSGSTPTGTSPSISPFARSMTVTMRIVLIGDVEPLAFWVYREQFRVGSGIDLARHLERRRIDDSNLVVVAESTRRLPCSRAP